MKKHIITLVAALALAASGYGQVLFSDNFNSYSDGNLVGQGSWLQTGASFSGASLAVAGGAASLVASGQDAYASFATQTLASSSGINLAMDINVSAATATGDYFAHFGIAGNSTNFYERFWAKSTTGGYLLGLLDNSGTGGVVTYGTDVLSFNTSYTISSTWNFLPLNNNDTFSLYITPSGGPTSLYLTHTWTSATAEPSTISSINLRQGGASSATLTVDNITVTAIPEPSTYALIMGVLTLGVIVVRRRAKRA